MSRSKKWKSKSNTKTDIRLEIFKYLIFIFAGLIILKLFSLQVLNYNFYKVLASSQHEMFKELIPARGSIYMHDYKDEALIPLATNQRLSFIYAEPKHIKDLEKTVDVFSEIFKYDDEKKEELRKRLDRPNDPYEPLEKGVTENILEKILEHDLDGIEFIRETARIYPDASLGGHIVGFIGSNDEGKKSGKYGIEGYFEDVLAGKYGFINSKNDISGRLIAVADRSVQKAEDGAKIILTIDRTLQFMTCSLLKEAVEEYGAEGGSVVIIEPATGKVMSMCGVPDFDPNNYSKVENINQFNNPAIFLAYEPGSIFKPITMAAALDSGKVTPKTKFEDTGSSMVDGWHKPIGNAEGKVYGKVDMTQVLEDSINTGMIFSMRETGMEKFVEYIKRFGFGEVTGIELDTEVAGDISSLDIGSEIYAATASFGQGITTTPLQIAMAYAAIANGGVLKKPQIIDKIIYPDETIETRPSVDITQVIDEKTAHTLSAMLVSVIEYGHGKRAGVDGYYIGGKTGTAQVAKTDGIGYSEDSTIGSFAGFGPVEDPKFAMVVRIDNPKSVMWAESTAAPLFGKIAEFLLQYFEVSPVRQVE